METLFEYLGIYFVSFFATYGAIHYTSWLMLRRKYRMR
jgi:hypothetical protein